MTRRIELMQSQFASPELVRRAGYRSRKALKRSLYQKAKVCSNQPLPALPQAKSLSWAGPL